MVLRSWENWKLRATAYEGNLAPLSTRFIGIIRILMGGGTHSRRHAATKLGRGLSNLSCQHKFSPEINPQIQSLGSRMDLFPRSQVHEAVLVVASQGTCIKSNKHRPCKCSPLPGMRKPLLAGSGRLYMYRINGLLHGLWRF